MQSPEPKQMYVTCVSKVRRMTIIVKCQSSVEFNKKHTKNTQKTPDHLLTYYSLIPNYSLIAEITVIPKVNELQITTVIS